MFCYLKINQAIFFLKSRKKKSLPIKNHCQCLIQLSELQSSFRIIVFSLACIMLHQILVKFFKLRPFKENLHKHLGLVLFLIVETQYLTPIK